jgi:hypothetical protein
VGNCCCGCSPKRKKSGRARQDWFLKAIAARPDFFLFGEQPQQQFPTFLCVGHQQSAFNAILSR